MIKGIWRWLDDRSGISSIWNYAFKHPVPARLTGRLGWLYVLGTATLAVFMLQVVTGVVLATIYIPSTAHAYDSLKFISNQATMGDVVRGLHYFGASAMVILVGAHIARVFLTGSYKFPRELNWLSGVVLLGLVFVMAFTGQLLRWDEDAVGSTLVAAEQAARIPILGDPLARLILAGKTIGGATLTRFYAIHVFLIPGLIFAVLGGHLFLVLRHGVSEPPRTGEPVDRRTYRQRYESLLQSGHTYFPDAFWREAAFAVLVIGVIFVLAVVVGPKAIGAPPDPTATEASPRPDWYLLWMFALLAVVPKQAEDLIIVFGPPILIALFLMLPFVGNTGERSPARRPWSVAIVLVVVVGIIGMLQVGLVAPWAPRFDTQPLSAQELGVSSGPAFEGSRVFYENGCQYCHGVLGEGGKRGADLTHVTSRLADDVIIARVLASPAGMPSYNGKLSSEDLQNLLSFLHQINETP